MKLQVFFEELDVEFISEQRSYEVGSANVLFCRAMQRLFQSATLIFVSVPRQRQLIYGGNMLITDKHTNQCPGIAPSLLLQCGVDLFS